MLIFYGPNGSFNGPSSIYGPNVIDWGTHPKHVTTNKFPAHWNLGIPLGFGGMILDWNGSTGTGLVFIPNPEGTIPFNPVGPLQFIYTGDSATVGTVQPYNDGIIAVPLLNISGPYPTVIACRAILDYVGFKNGGYPAQPYKLQVIKNGVLLYTIRSILWGSQQNQTDQPNTQTTDRQYQGNNQPPQ